MRFVVIAFIILVSVPSNTFAQEDRPLASKAYSGTIQSGDGSSFMVTLTLDAAGNGTLVSNPIPPDQSWLCQGTLVPVNRNSEEIRSYDYVVSGGSSDGCVGVGVVSVNVSDGVGKLSYSFKWQNPEKPSLGYRLSGMLTDVNVGSRDVGSMVAQFDDIFESDRFILVENLNITYDDFLAMMVWKGWHVEDIESSQIWPKFTDEFAERREKKAFRDRLLTRAADLDRSADDIAFRFSGAPVSVGEYDFDRNMLELCVMINAGLNTDGTLGPFVQFGWAGKLPAGISCPNDGFAFANGRTGFLGASVNVAFKTIEEGEAFTKRVRMMRLTSDMTCGGAVTQPGRNYAFYCKPSTLVIYGTGGDVVFQKAFDDGQWWEDF